MELVTEQKIKETVLGILKSANLEESTEYKVRVAASERLGIDLSDVDHKRLVRDVVESFLLTCCEVTGNGNTTDTVGREDTGGQQDVQRKLVDDVGDRLICKLTGKRNVVVQEFRGKTYVSIRDYYEKAGKLIPSAKGIHLTPEQWANFRNYIPAVEEVVRKMQSKLRPEQPGEQNEHVVKSVIPPPEQPGEQNEHVTKSATLPPEQPGEQNEHVAKSAPPPSRQPAEQNEQIAKSAVPPPELFQPDRFNGKNYLFWAPQMESFLKELKLSYVLNEPCPRVTLSPQAGMEETAILRASEQKWINDDCLCRRHILNFLSDQLYYKYSKKSESSKEIWEGLKSVYLYEEYGTKRAQVKKYIEFQIVDGKSVLEQVAELNNIADSIVASNMPVDETFHVSVIISKLSLSWKDFSIKLMCKEHLSFFTLMDRIRVEEESRSQGWIGESYKVADHHLPKPYGPRTKEMKRPGTWRRREPDVDSKNVVCYNCQKKGHVAKYCHNKKVEKETSEKLKGDDSKAPEGQGV